MIRLSVAAKLPISTLGKLRRTVCGNVQTANATISIIDTVLMPRPPDDDGAPPRGATVARRA